MNKEEKILRGALEKYGAVKQTLKTMEEMSELQKELCKNQFGADNKQAIAEEIADVEIMLDQMKLLYDIENSVSHWRLTKLARLSKKIAYEQPATAWIDYKDLGIMYQIKCSNCGKIRLRHHTQTPEETCPKCNSKMRTDIMIMVEAK